MRTACCAAGVLVLSLALVAFSQRRAPKLLVVSLDGFRADDVDPVNTPSLYLMSQTGVSARSMKPVFGTKTYPNHMSMATGLFEEEHGIVHNAMFDPVFNATFDETNSESRWWDDGRVNPIWTANQAENDGLIRNSGTIMWPGSEVAFKKIRPKFHMPYDPKPNLTLVAETIVDWLSQDANCIFVYINQPDETSHLFGPFAPQVKHMVHTLDSFIGYTRRRLKDSGLEQGVNLIVLSDHGMSEVTSHRVIEMNDFVNRSSYEMYGRSPLWNIRPKPGMLDYVYDSLKRESLKRKNFKVYRKSEVPPEYHYRDNRRIGDIVLLADEGYDMVDEKKNLKPVPGSVWGNHGYNNSLSCMRPLFLAVGPALVSPLVLEEAFLNLDLYPLMCMVLQLIPLSRFPSSGSLKVLHKILKPIVRSAESDASIFSVVTVVLVIGLLVLAVAACCIFLFASIGRKRRRPELDWDPGVTEFDFGQEWDMQSIGFKRRKAKVTPPSSESVLLMDGDENPDHEPRLLLT